MIQTMRPQLLFLLLLAVCDVAGAESTKYRLTDPQLKVVPIDSSPTESFLSMRADSTGRLFVGGREGLFVYEPSPTGRGGYGPRQELYRFPPDSWVYDIEIRGHDLYVLTLSALYLFPDGVIRREDLEPRRLIWGPPDWHVHQAFHGLAWGPAGNLYISMGDLLVFYGDFNRPDHWGHWTMFSQPAGTRTPYTGVGGVFRCRPDGSRLKVVAGGTRNSCGLVFDADWNLFSNDNDHEGLPTEYVPGRLIHVTPYADFGWPRGWMPRKTPDRLDLLETMCADMGRGVPVGQTYYDEQYLPEAYRHNLLVARWGRRTIARYPVRPRGASFAADEVTLLEGFNTTRPVGVAVGRGGRIFATLSYMAHNEGSPVYASDLVMITRADDTDAHPYQPVELTKLEASQLETELASRSSWPARRAHLELQRRGGLGGDSIRRLEMVLRGQPEARLASRLIWLAASGLPELGEPQRERFLDLLERIVDESRLDVGLQAVRAAAEFLADHERGRKLLLRAMTQPDPRLQHLGLVGLINSKHPLPDGAARLASSQDTYVRQAAAILLARRGSPQQLQALSASSEPSLRLAAVLAAGFRLTLPQPTAPLATHLPLQPWRDESPYIVQYANETIDLRQQGRLGLFRTAEHWNAGRRTVEQEAMFELLSSRLADSQESVRLQAAHFLHLLNDTRSELRVAAVRQRSQRERLVRAPLTGISEVWIAGPFDDRGQGFDTQHPPQQTAVDLTATYPTELGEIGWQKMRRGRMFDFHQAFGDTSGKSVYAYFRLESPRSQPGLLLPGSDDGLEVWHNGTRVFQNDIERGGLPLQDIVFLDLQPGSNDLLVRVRNVADQHNLYLHFRSLAGSVKNTLPEPLDETGLTERLKSAQSAPGVQLPAEMLEVDWEQAAKLGDAERGRRLFSAEGIGCVKCHSVDNRVGVAGGPSLADSHRRFTVRYLVESILLPSHKVSPVFRGSLIATKEGRILRGLIISETAAQVELLTSDAQRIVVAKSAIESLKPLEQSPMPAGIVKRADELRDLLAFLLASGKDN